MDRNRGNGMTVRFATDEKVVETLTKGNQEKRRDGDQQYKLEQFGYEAQAETAISTLLEYSNIKRDTTCPLCATQQSTFMCTGGSAQLAAACIS